MGQITEQGRASIAQLAQRHQVSEATVAEVLRAVQHGHGTAAQFNIKELGGMGQWSSGGMTQVGDMFNDSLKARVRDLCADVAKLLSTRTVFDEEPHSQNADSDGAESHKAAGWWPRELGSPSSTGGQNDMAYALFPAKHRLAVRDGGKVTVYDSGDHQIGGFAQAQSTGTQTLHFTSQHGTISTADLKQV